MVIMKIGAWLMAAAVAMGAFGAHSLKSTLSNHMLDVYKTANFYHFVHALALLWIGLWQVQAPSVKLMIPAILIIVGLGLFSGSLYVLSISGQKWLGAITPFGGMIWIAAWVWLAVRVS